MSDSISRIGFAAPLVDGTFPLSAAAAAHLADLRQVRAIPVQDVSTEEP